MDGTLPTVFEMLQYFKTILTSVESLWSSIQDEVYLTITELDSKYVQGMNQQLLKTSGADVLPSKRKVRKTLRGVASTPPPPPLYVQGFQVVSNRDTTKSSNRNISELQF